MNYLEKFSIPFGGMTDGEHEFVYEIDDKFFEHFENSPVTHGFFDILVTVNKKHDMMLIDFTMEGTIRVACDRCGEDMELETNGYNELAVKFGDDTGEEDEDTIIISPKEKELNIAQFIYEYICLMLPMRHVHADDKNGQSTCNPEILRKLESLIPHEESHPDPRWDILKSINLN